MSIFTCYLDKQYNVPNKGHPPLLDHFTRCWELTRRSEIRYDANCAGVVEVTFANRIEYLAATGRVINISTRGCLFLSEKLPWQNNDIDKIESRIFSIIAKECIVYLPWINAHLAGMVRSAGAFTIGIEFDEILTNDFVIAIADLEPNQARRFVPKCPWKYDRILPLAHRSTANRKT